MMRFRVETNASGHTDLRLKVWQSGTTEPGTWDIEKLDVNEAKLNGVTGRFGLYANIGVSDPNRRIYFDDYQADLLGTGGGSGGSTTLDPIVDLASHVGNLTATATSDSQIDLSWSDQSGIEDGYRIERSPDGINTWTVLSDIAADSTSYSDTTVNASTHYWYRVVPHNEGEDSPNAEIIDTTALDATNEVREYWTDDDYSSWSSKWSFDSGESNSIIYKDVARSPYGSQSADMLAYINNKTAEDVDQTVQLRFSNPTGAKGGLIARRSDSDPDTYFMARTGQAVGGDGDDVYLYKVVDGTQTPVGALFSYDTGGASSRHMMRFRVETNANGYTDLRLKIWNIEDPEPTTWNLEKLDVNEAKLNGVSGRFGVVAHNGVSDRRVWFDNYQASIITSLRAAGGEQSTGHAPALQQDQLSAIVAAAQRRWIDAGIDANTAGFEQVQFQIADLGGDLLGRTVGHTITLDTNAAGHGWFVDHTPDSDVEYRGQRGPAGMDLLTVVAHELGHTLGLTHGTGLASSGTLAEGVRRVPTATADGPAMVEVTGADNPANNASALTWLSTDHRPNLDRLWGNTQHELGQSWRHHHDGLVDLLSIYEA